MAEEIKKASYIRSVLSLLIFDIDSRTLSVLLQYIINLLPDLFVFSPIRALSLKIMGAKINRLTGLIIRRGGFIEYPRNLILGRNVQINLNCYIGNNAIVEIGSHTRIAEGVKILTTFHRGLNYFGKDVLRPVKIGSGVHLGVAAIVMPGTIIGENVLVAPGAVVSGVLRENGIYAGNPARLVSFRDDLDE